MILVFTLPKAWLVLRPLQLQEIYHDGYNIKFNKNQF